MALFWGRVVEFGGDWTSEWWRSCVRRPRICAGTDINVEVLDGRRKVEGCAGRIGHIDGPAIVLHREQ